MMDIKKVYIDTRFKTEDSNSDSDFFIDLPRSLNVPENTICYINDIVIPVSWSTVDGRNNKFYMFVDSVAGTDLYKIIELPAHNYSGPDFCADLEAAINAAFYPDPNLTFDVLYDANDNQITFSNRLANPIHTFVYFVSDVDLISGKHWSSPLPKESLNSMSKIIRMGDRSHIMRDNTPFVACLDLHTIRNVYLTSSSLASYNVVSNFNNDMIIRKIPVKANFSQMLYDGGEAGYDFLDVSKRSLSRLDFKLLDSYGNVLDLRGNHWSFSLVFQTK